MSDKTEPQLLSAERLAEIEVREQAATPGPWEAEGLPYAEDADDPVVLAAGKYIAQTVYDSQSTTQQHAVDADTQFIAHARQDVPALLAHAAAQQAFFDARNKEMSQAHDAFRQQVATELAELRAIADAVYQFNGDFGPFNIEQSATRLGLELP